MNKNNQKLWIVSELFYPDESSTAFILTKIAQKLANKFDTKVICGPENYGFKKNGEVENKTIINGNIDIIRLKKNNYDKNKILSRIFGQIILTYKLINKLKKNIKPNDKVLIVTNPALLLLLTSYLKKRRKFQLTILVHDVFPENTIPAGILKNRSIIYKILKKLFDKAYSSANKLIVLGEDMKEIIENKVSKKSFPTIKIIENWADTRNITPKNKLHCIPAHWNSDNKIVFLFAGNLGRVQGLDFFIEVIKKVNNERLVFVFKGEGAFKSKLIEIVKNEKLSNVIIENGYARNEQQNVLNSCDIGIVTLSDKMYGLGVPSKAYNLISAGKALLYIGDRNSHIAKVIKSYQIGWNFEMKEIDKLILFFNKLDHSRLDEINTFGKKARDLAERRYSEEKILEEFQSVI